MNLPGGRLIAGIGSYIQIWNWSTNGVSQPIKINYNYINVVTAELTAIRNAPSLWHSGCFGAMRHRAVCADWNIHGYIWYDYSSPPDLVFTQGNSLAFKLLLGADVSWTGNPGDLIRQANFVGNDQANSTPVNIQGNSGLLERGSTYIPCYVSPMATYVGGKNIANSTGEEEIMQEFNLTGDSLLWYLNSQEAEGIYEQYINAINYQIANT